MRDPERLQSTLDDIADTVDWAVKWLEVLEEEVRFAADSDRPLLEVDAKRLRLVADAVVPERVRDPSSRKRWYLAPDDGRQRADDVDAALDAADSEVTTVIKLLDEQRREETHREARKKERGQARAARDQEHRDQVTAYLREHGASTVKEIAAATGLSTVMARWAADVVAKRGRDQRFRLPEGGQNA